jgi:signal transduction histidine kinase
MSARAEGRPATGTRSGAPSFRSRLRGLVAAACLPLIAIVGLLMADDAAEAVAAAREEAAREAEDLRGRLETLYRSMFERLGVIAQLRSLRGGDLAAFAEQAAGFRFEDVASVGLVRSDGTFAYHSSLREEAADRRLRNLEPFLPVLDGEGRPTVFLASGPRTGRFGLVFAVPTIVGGERMALTLAVYAEVLREVVATGRPGFVAKMIDADGRIVAHRADPDARVGEAASPEIRAALAAEGGARSVVASADGAVAYTALTTSAATGLSVVVGAPVAKVRAGVLRQVSLFLVPALAAAAVAVLAAGAVARRMGDEVVAVARAAEALGDERADAAVRPAPRTEELAALAGDIARAGGLIAARRREAEAALARARSAERAKTAFLAQMSHELRTPLNAIIGFTDLILSDEAGRIGADARHAYIGHVRDAGERMLNVVDDLLDLSWLDMGPAVSGGTAAPAAAISRAFELAGLASPHPAPAIHVSVDVADPADDRLAADERFLARTLAALVQNAVGRSPPGGRVALTAGPAGDGAYVFRIADVGDDPSELELSGGLDPSGSEGGDHTCRIDRGGFGLKLAVGSRLAAAAGWDVAVGGNHPRGLAVELRLARTHAGLSVPAAVAPGAAGGA